MRKINSNGLVKQNCVVVLFYNYWEILFWPWIIKTTGEYNFNSNLFNFCINVLKTVKYKKLFFFRTITTIFDWINVSFITINLCEF